MSDFASYPSERTASAFVGQLMKATLFAVGFTMSFTVSAFTQVLQSNACDRLKSLALPNADVTAADVVRVGPFRCEWCTADQTVDVPSYCRVKATMRPTSDSDIEMELWMPLADWNGKLLGVGNANFCGGIDTPQLAHGLAEHYAAVATDLGHKGCDASFAMRHPEKVIDFGYRALHETTLRAKDLVSAYYGNAPKRSYFKGCSTGGNEALMEAQRYPEDYDGVIAGAPTNYLTHLHASRIWNVQVASVLSREKLEMLHRAVVAACDSGDAIGLLDDPRQCQFDPETLLCAAGEDSSTCLTRAQVDAVRKIYAGPSNSRSGEAIYPGLERGSELGWNVREPGPNELSYYRDAVHEDPAWDWRSFDIDRDVALADQNHRVTLNAVDPDLGRFAAGGGKLILYHGWNDNLAPRNTVNYYEGVVATMGTRADTVVRLFMIPRVGHCGGGAGTDQFNALAALERWVEVGIAPDRITAQHVTGNRVDMERPLCPYPQVARWKGVGSMNDASNFECALSTGSSPK